MYYKKNCLHHNRAGKLFKYRLPFFTSVYNFNIMNQTEFNGNQSTERLVGQPCVGTIYTYKPSTRL